MTRSRIIASILFGAVVLLGLALKLWGVYSRPFELGQFVNYIAQNQFVVAPPREISAFAKENGVALNQAGVVSLKDLRRRGYLVDVPRVLGSWTIPASWRSFVRSSLFSSGVAFPCLQIFLVDGSIMKRDPRSFMSRMSGLPEKDLKDSLKDMPAKDFLFIAFVHEFTHVAELHYETRDLDKLLGLGNHRMNSGDIEGARKYFQDSVNFCPAYVDGLDNLAITERRLGRPERALALYERSLLLKPSGEIARQNIVWALIDLRRFDEARKEVTKLKELHPNNPEGYFVSGVVAIQSGDLNGGRSELDIARTLYLKAADWRVLHADVLRLGIGAKTATGEKALNALVTEYRTDCRGLAKGASLAACDIARQELLGSSLSLLGPAIESTQK